MNYNVGSVGRHRGLDFEYNIARVHVAEVGHNSAISYVGDRYELDGINIPRVESLVLDHPEGARFNHGCNLNPLGLVDNRRYCGIFVLFHGVSNMYKPLPSLDNFISALAFRIFNITDSLCSDQCVINSLSYLRTGAKILALDMSESGYNSWFNSLRPIQKKKISRIIEAERKGESIKKNTTVFTKSDEILYNVEKFIPRLIFNTHPYYLHKLGYFVYVFSKYLAKNVFPKEPKLFCEINNKKVFCYFTCGATSNDLNHFFNAAHRGEKGIYLMVMGDDTAAVDTTGDKIKYIETDYSKFDRTQSDSLKGIFLTWLRENGFSQYANFWEELYSQKVVYYHRRSKTKLHYPKVQMFLTGEPGTCLRNSITNIVISAHALAYDDDNYYKEAGLKVKKTVKYEPTVTFLRGVFLPSDQGFSWTRLPSFLLKFGKSMNDPKNLFDKKVPMINRFKMFLHAQWLGYGKIENNWFYRAIGQQIRRLTDRLDPTISINLHEWQIKSSGEATVCDNIFNIFMSERYGIDINLMNDYIKFLSTRLS